MTDDANRVSARADLFGGAAWMAFGIAVVVASWTMDRLEQFGATVYTAPGLVPGILGALIVVLGAILALRALRGGAAAGLAAPWLPTPDGRAALRRTSIAAALALVYTLVLIGRVPFELATVLFVFAFIVVFDVSPTAPRSLPRRAIVAAITAVATTATVALVFERIFLVRLP